MSKQRGGKESAFFRIKLIGRCAAQRRRNISDPVTVALKFAVQDLIVKPTESVTANLLPTGPVCRGPSHSGLALGGALPGLGPARLLQRAPEAAAQHELTTACKRPRRDRIVGRATGVHR